MAARRAGAEVHLPRSPGGERGPISPARGSAKLRRSRPRTWCEQAASFVQSASVQRDGRSIGVCRGRWPARTRLHDRTANCVIAASLDAVRTVGLRRRAGRNRRVNRCDAPSPPAPGTFASEHLFSAIAGPATCGLNGPCYCFGCTERMNSFISSAWEAIVFSGPVALMKWSWPSAGTIAAIIR